MPERKCNRCSYVGLFTPHALDGLTGATVCHGDLGPTVSTIAPAAGGPERSFAFRGIDRKRGMTLAEIKAFVIAAEVARYPMDSIPRYTSVGFRRQIQGLEIRTDTPPMRFPGEDE